MSERNLDKLRLGESARVAEVTADPAMRRRLLDLGLVPGTWVTCVSKSPAGDPTAYRIRGAVIALRGVDAAEVRLWDREGRPAPLCRTALA
ncbi:ferrous iron transport protein A [Pseudoflavonifractor sp. 524-17]|uniref:FeoA family protein n=1 Tax=Pseudoflavonifractor sp. 524-17 TaxID=2304577 RepID=UPI00137B17CB|nr:FeoA family protein [Pseudoflavonifractor sp. 524-17]NCE63365.1 ferrous iron transport protein A [Pseudoflavonifractor sp. 524-17]